MNILKQPASTSILQGLIKTVIRNQKECAGLV